MRRASGRARQLLTHLAQAEMVFANRLRFVLADDGYVIQPFDQDAWMRVEPWSTDTRRWPRTSACGRSTSACAVRWRGAARTDVHPSRNTAR